MTRNAFALRTSEQSSPDDTFTRYFAADALQILPDDVFVPGALVIRSAPGGGKTSLLRMFTPGPLLQVARNRKNPPYDEIYSQLDALGTFDRTGPGILGIYLSSSSGYAEIGPPLPEELSRGLFRALLNARIVLRTLRAVCALSDLDYPSGLGRLQIETEPGLFDQGAVPQEASATDLRAWAEQTEALCLRHLDTLSVGEPRGGLPAHPGIDAIRWLAQSRFCLDGAPLAHRPLLMFDDVQRLRPWQREILFAECMEHRTAVMVWLAEQTKALDPQEVLSASRSNRDYRVIQLERAWSDKSKRFQAFATAIADRRLRQVGDDLQFAASLASDLSDQKIQARITAAVKELRKEMSERAAATNRYDYWVRMVAESDHATSAQEAIDWARVGILIARDRNKPQRSFDLEPLPDSDLNASGVAQAAERFVAQRFGVPYYYGIERIVRLASYNVEEFLQICAALYDLIHASRVVRSRRPTAVSAADQEAAVRKLAERRFAELSRSVRHGEMAQKLVEAVGTMSRERTYEPNAPYAPGVTGFGLSAEDRIMLADAALGKKPSLSIYTDLAAVLTSCVAQNVFDMRDIRHDNREFTVFYLNRTLCARFDLVYHMGGWQRVSLRRLAEWCRGSLPQAVGRLSLT
ncbi:MULTISPECIES: ORC-CDC6 family AAA ATPase [Microvirga]|uniref:ORC-CDC6 family AAA ATPase n=1 Tax=Microvirga TaxID=186650 RepID=UPI0021C90105|nr:MULTISPECIES: hypothetical protein [unclassified Microvirga]